MHTNKYSSHPWSRKFLFTTDGNHHRKSQLIKIQSCGAQSQQIHLPYHSCYLRHRDRCGRAGGKIIRARETEIWCDTVSPGNFRSYSHKVSHTWLATHDQSKDNTNRHANVDWGKLRSFSPRQSTADISGTLRAEEIIFSREEHTN